MSDATTTAPTGIATLAMMNLDSPDPGALADFYSAVLGWPVVHREDEYAMINSGVDGVAPIGFGRIDTYRAPQWPDSGAPKRFHLDFYVDDPDEAAARCVALGATRPEFQPGGERWTVVLDPAGHPFCLCRRS
ncbi:VOC family protein [Cryptosporangium minutisporangium]|uniref:VOC family protein n=1 Tax=Cryptosporangium minutisporangium TaxID=113569 RepID=A0ABP6TBH5_9ACTN